jgi:hypothetical protein
LAAISSSRYIFSIPNYFQVNTMTKKCNRLWDRKVLVTRLLFHVTRNVPALIQLDRRLRKYANTFYSFSFNWASPIHVFYTSVHSLRSLLIIIPYPHHMMCS